MLKLILSDFDGTLTDHTEMGPIFFDVLELLSQKNLELVIVTGRGTSWAHFLLTHFEALKMVVVEGGGVIISKDPSQNEFKETFLVSEVDRKKLFSVTEMLLKKFPSLKLSSDSLGRLCDQAIELSRLDLMSDKGAAVEEFLKAEGINFSKSNVHLNFWAGNPSKAKSIEYILKERNIEKNETVYFGDSLNDESVFSYLPTTVGVSNIKNVLPKLKSKPSIILEGKENRGPYGVFNYLSEVLK